MSRPTLYAVAFCFLVSVLSGVTADASYQYFRIGHEKDATSSPVFGIAMMGGGSDLDEAFHWLCQKANGGDFLILRARGGDDYNAYVNGLCKLNSVATLIIPDRATARKPEVANIIRHAAALFIAGGDQARYIRYWQGTPVQEAINADIAEGKPIGGTSAGLAVEGEFVYAALGDKPDDADLASPDVLRNPYFDRVTLVRGFLTIPQLRNTITDSHFAKRDRMGRSLGFLARIMQDGWSKNPREIAVDEKSAVLVESDGKAMVVGSGKGAYFLRPTEAPITCREGTSLTFHSVSLYKAQAGSRFDLSQWTGEGGVSSILSVDQGIVGSNQPGDVVY
jgi:cyanophycinase